MKSKKFVSVVILFAVIFAAIIFTSNKKAFADVALPAPAISGISSSENGITITWEAVPGADSYRVYRKVPGEDFRRIVDFVDGTSFTDTNPAYGQQYIYAVRSMQNGELGDYNSTKAFTLLKTPALLSIESKDSGMYFSWESVNGASGYRLYRKVPGSSWKIIANVSSAATDYLDKNMESGVTYTYTVRAKASDGSFGYYERKGISCERLESPDNITVGAVTSGVRITWDVQAGATSYRVYRKEPGESFHSIVQSVSSTKYTDTTAEKGKTYIYAVRSMSESCFGLYDSSAKFSYLQTPVLEEVSNKANGLMVSWEAVPKASYYQVYRHVSGNYWKHLATVSASNLSYIDTGVSHGSSYTYTVRAKASDGSLSSYDPNGISYLRLNAPKLSEPELKTSSITIKWSSVSGADKYRVYRKMKGGSWSRLGDTTSLSYTDSISGSTEYIYTVRAIKNGYLGDFDRTGVSSLNMPAKVVALAKSYLGTTSSREFVDIYNSQSYPPRGAYISYYDPWCACFVSAIALKLGITNIMPTEISCGYMIERYKNLGRWVEDDSYVPSPGDVIFYCWDDSGYGDCTSWPGHVGIVEKVSGSTIYVIEGNKSDAVGRREISINGRYIRGYGIPKY